MKINDHIDMKGRLRLQIWDKAGVLVRDFAADNAIVLTGRDLVAKQFIGEAIAPVKFLAVGTGNTAVNAATDTKLAKEIFRKEVKTITTSTDLTNTPEGKKKLLLSAELDFGEAAGTLTEAGLFNHVSDGIMYNRVVFPPVTKTTDFKLTLIWEIIF